MANRLQTYTIIIASDATPAQKKPKNATPAHPPLMLGAAVCADARWRALCETTCFGITGAASCSTDFSVTPREYRAHYKPKRLLRLPCVSVSGRTSALQTLPGRIGTGWTQECARQMLYDNSASMLLACNKLSPSDMQDPTPRNPLQLSVDSEVLFSASQFDL